VEHPHHAGRKRYLFSPPCSLRIPLIGNPLPRITAIGLPGTTMTCSRGGRRVLPVHGTGSETSIPLKRKENEKVRIGKRTGA